jgi:hypothetical protein
MTAETRPPKRLQHLRFHFLIHTPTKDITIGRWKEGRWLLVETGDLCQAPGLREAGYEYYAPCREPAIRPVYGPD